MTATLAPRWTPPVVQDVRDALHDHPERYTLSRRQAGVLASLCDDVIADALRLAGAEDPEDFETSATGYHEAYTEILVTTITELAYEAFPEEN